MNYPMPEDIVMPGEELEHAWFSVQFNYGGYVECECGFRPQSEAEFATHQLAYGI